MFKHFMSFESAEFLRDSGEFFFPTVGPPETEKGASIKKHCKLSTSTRKQLLIGLLHDE